MWDVGTILVNVGCEIGFMMIEIPTMEYPHNTSWFNVSPSER